MAIKNQDYVKTKESCIYLHKKDKRQFLFYFKINGKKYRKLFRVEATNHSNKDNLKEARRELDNIKDDIRGGSNISKSLKLDDLFKKYMKTQPQTDWTHKKQHVYDLYIGESKIEGSERKSTRDFTKVKKLYGKTKIGHKVIADILSEDIDQIISVMEKNDLSPRTRKSILEILNPLFKYAIRNKYLDESPCEFTIVKIPSQKKIVTNATELFKKVYSGITTFYQDEPFFQALFLFSFSGRRKTEILSLKWENIDLNGDYYWIEDTKNGEKQRFPLPMMVKAALQEIKDNREGLVFKSPVTGRQIKNIDRQMAKLKKFIGVDNLTLHYMRNILVSALAEQSTEAVTLSGILGHKDINTINKYLSNSTMKSGLKGLKAIDNILDVEVIDD